MKLLAKLSSMVALGVTALMLTGCSCWDPCCCDPCPKPVCCPKPCPAPEPCCAPRPCEPCNPCGC